jgi:8-oxo-dGTP pyrophosphatase MutT (NUDIX family)
MHQDKQGCLSSGSCVMDDFLPSPDLASLDQVAAVYLLRGDGAALLQHRDDKPGLRHAAMWVPPGGHCDPGEAPLACARREMFEETNYRCDRLHYLTTLRDDPGHGWRPFCLHVFFACYDQVQTIECREGQGVEFIPRAEAKSLRCPDFVLPVWDRALAALARNLNGTSEAACPYANGTSEAACPYVKTDNQPKKP